MSSTWYRKSYILKKTIICKPLKVCALKLYSDPMRKEKKVIFSLTRRSCQRNTNQPWPLPAMR